MQTKEVHYMLLAIKDTVDEYCLATQGHKLDMIQEVCRNRNHNVIVIVI